MERRSSSSRVHSSLIQTCLTFSVRSVVNYRATLVYISKYRCLVYIISKLSIIYKQYYNILMSELRTHQGVQTNICFLVLLAQRSFGGHFSLPSVKLYSLYSCQLAT